MKAEWRRWSAQFAARSRREKLIIAAAAFALTYLAVDAVWLAPAFRAFANERKLAAQKAADLAQLEGELARLAQQIRQQEVQLQAALESGQRDLAGVAAQLAEFERTLVPARRMTEFLRGLLPGSGLEVVSLKTLPPTPLIGRETGKASAPAPGQPAKPEAKAALPTSRDAANLYKHGVEITLAGSYPALLAYLNRIESSPQKVLWGRLDLRSDKYPRSELTLTLYTLSLDQSWLVV